MSGPSRTSTRLPPQAAPTPAPESSPVPGSILGEDALPGVTEALARRRKKGRRSLILTDGGLGVSQNQGIEQKKSLLG